MSSVNGGTMPNDATMSDRANTKLAERIINLFTPTQKVALHVPFFKENMPT